MTESEFVRGARATADLGEAFDKSRACWFPRPALRACYNPTRTSSSPSREDRRDTNVLGRGLVRPMVCAAISSSGRSRPSSLSLRGACLDELARVSPSRKFETDPKRTYPFGSVPAIQATIVRPAAMPLCGFCRDRDETKVLAAAIAGKSRPQSSPETKICWCLVALRKSRILSPRQFVELLDRLP